MFAYMHTLRAPLGTCFVLLLSAVTALGRSLYQGARLGAFSKSLRVIMHMHCTSEYFHTGCACVQYCQVWPCTLAESGMAVLVCCAFRRLH